MKSSFKIDKQDLNNLKNTFKKFDTCKKNFLTQQEFRDLLNSLAINTNSDDMFSVLSEFDPDLKGMFSCEIFIKSLIDSCIFNL